MHDASLLKKTTSNFGESCKKNEVRDLEGEDLATKKNIDMFVLTQQPGKNMEELVIIDSSLSYRSNFVLLICWPSMSTPRFKGKKC